MDFVNGVAAVFVYQQTIEFRKAYSVVDDLKKQTICREKRQEKRGLYRRCWVMLVMQKKMLFNLILRLILTRTKQPLKVVCKQHYAVPHHCSVKDILIKK